MKRELINKLSLIVAKYEALGLTTQTYKWLKQCLNDETWLSATAKTLTKIENGEKIFNISKEINTDKNDQRVDEMFAEFDLADRLANTKFFGVFGDITYLKRSGTQKQPDFIAKNQNGITPFEVKLMSPNELGENKFFQKFIDKVKSALEQLIAYAQKQSFENGEIFVWTHSQISLHNINYNELNKKFEQQIQKQSFNLRVVFILYRRGMWDFYR